jgi:hypothetical protein
MKLQNHRNLLNIDANVWMYRYRPPAAFYRPPGQKLTAQDIDRYVGVIADAGVDTLVVNAHCTQLAYYPSKKVPTCLDNYKRGDYSFFYGHVLGWEMTPEQIQGFFVDSAHYMDGYLDLVEAGIDWLAETAASCRRRGVSPWTSVRMNDVHGATKYIPGSFLNCELYKDPAMRLRGTTFNPQAAPQNSNQGFNYAKKEVRDHVMAAIKDIVENYDYEGLGLEWNRSPLCCEPGASRATVDMITDWHAEVREVTQAQAKKIGKPFPVGIRYVGSLDQMLSIGLDFRAMVKRGIIDFITPTNFWQSSWDIPCDDLRKELGPDVTILGSVEMAPNWLHGYLPNQKKGNPGLGAAIPINYRLSPYCRPMMRGNAAAKLVLGVDGLEVYNFACADQVSHWPWMDEPGHADYPVLNRLADLDYLRGKEKFYTQSSQYGYYVMQPFESVAAFPTAIAPGESRSLRMPMCAEPAAVTGEDAMELVIQVVVKKSDALPPVGIAWNGLWPRFDGTPDDRLLFPLATMTHHIPNHTAFNFVFPLETIREGWNEVIVLNGVGKDFGRDQLKENLNVVALEAAVRKR